MIRTFALLAFMALAGAPSGGEATAKPNPNWKTGKLMLNNGIEVGGELNYNWKAEIVQLRANGKIKAYSAQQVARFIYFDENSNTIRQFSSVNYPVKKGLLRPVILEKFATGALTVYRRLRHNREPLQLDTPNTYDNDENLVGDFENFVYYVYTDNTFTNLDHFQRDIFPRMNQEFGPELKRYAQVRQLDTGTIQARIMLINQYNNLKMDRYSSAKRPESAAVSEE